MFEIIDKKGVRRKAYAVNGPFFLIYVEGLPGEWLEGRGWRYLPMEECVPAGAASGNENRCVACGAIIPEGTQVCRRCGAWQIKN